MSVGWDWDEPDDPENDNGPAMLPWDAERVMDLAFKAHDPRLDMQSRLRIVDRIQSVERQYTKEAQP